VCRPQRVIVPLQVLGYVPYRPIGKSHFQPMPMLGGDCDNDKYLPSKMTELALSKSVTKALDPLKCYPDVKLNKIFSYLRGELSKMWWGENVTDYAEAVQLLNFEKSPGYPYYYDSLDKAEALQKHGDEIQSEVSAVVTGEERWMPFTLTLKDELRTRERVEEDKTRGFCASGIVHLLCSKMMFSKQNEKLHANFGKHPVTLGVSVPGPQFVRAVLSLGNLQNCYDADGDGCDQRFNLGVAYVIREVRKAFLAERYHACVDLLYDAVYAGDVIVCGVIHRLLHNKSGWENTSDDNSLYMWGVVFEAIEALTMCEFEDVCELLVNGDDLAMSIDYENVSIKDVAEYLAGYGVRISFDMVAPRFARDITFLSHTLKWRFIPKLGDVLVAAGNLEKLRSSLHWVKTTQSLTFEESCLAHLLGLRICLWPWRIDFIEVEEIIDRYLSSVRLTEVMSLLLRGRLSEVEILNLHLRLEGGVTFLPTLLSSEFIEVEQVTTCLIKDLVDRLQCKNNRPNLQRLSAQRRANVIKQ